MADLVRDFLADETGDLAVVDGDFGVIAGSDAIPQGIDCRVKTFLTEIYLDESQGVPWLEDVFIKNPDPIIVKEDIRDAIADTPDVTDVVNTAFNIDEVTRQGEVSYNVATVYSTDTLQGTTRVPG